MMGQRTCIHVIDKIQIFNPHFKLWFCLSLSQCTTCRSKEDVIKYALTCLRVSFSWRGILGRTQCWAVPSCCFTSSTNLRSNLRLDVFKLPDLSAAGESQQQRNQISQAFFNQKFKILTYLWLLKQIWSLGVLAPRCPPCPKQSVAQHLLLSLRNHQICDVQPISWKKTIIRKRSMSDYQEVQDGIDWNIGKWQKQGITFWMHRHFQLN